MTYAGDLTPQHAWDLLEQVPDAILVDVRTEPEWRYVGVPDLSALAKRPVLIEWSSYPNGELNADFVAQLRAAGAKQGTPLVFLCRSGQRSIGAATAATADGLGPCYNVLDGFEGALDADGHRGTSGWRASGLAWQQS